MRLFVAEKPSLGRAIAAELGVTQNNPTFQICGSDTVTWCFGHILAPYDPQDYDDNLRTWRRRDLPIIPTEWKLRPKESALTQLQVINHLLSEASSVVHAGDPDREGQLLVDEVLEHFHYTGPVQRIWLASLDSLSVQKALSTLKDNSNYANLRDAARARSQADWLIGMESVEVGANAGAELLTVEEDPPGPERRTGPVGGHPPGGRAGGRDQGLRARGLPYPPGKPPK